MLRRCIVWTALVTLLGCPEEKAAKVSNPRAPPAPAAPKIQTEEIVLDTDEPTATKWGPTLSLVLLSHKHGKGFTSADYRLTAEHEGKKEAFEFRVTSSRDWYGEKKLLGRTVRIMGREANSGARIVLPGDVKTSTLSSDALFEKVEKDSEVQAEITSNGGRGATAGRSRDWGGHEFSYGVAEDKGDVIVKVGAISGEILDISFEVRETPLLHKKPN